MVPIRQRPRLNAALLVCGALLCALPAFADPTPLSPQAATALRTRFEARQREARTWSARFTQILALTGIVHPVVSEGTIRFRAPDLLRIDFTQPAGEYSLVTGEQVFFQKPGRPLETKGLRTDSAGKPLLSLLGLLRGQPAEDEKSFDVEVGQDGDRYVIVLTRKTRASNRLPRRITNTLSAATLDVRETLVELPNGGTLTYRFAEPVRNGPLPEGLFNAPAGR